MMSKRMVFVYLLSAALIMAGLGCTSTIKKEPGVSLGGIQLAKLTRSQYSILDTVEGTGKTVTVLWLFRFPWSQKLGYSEWASGVENPGLSQAMGSALDSLVRSGQKKAAAMAMYNAIAQAPNADAVLPLRSTVETTGIPFLFRVNTATVKAKSIRVKTDSDLGLTK